MVTFDGLGNFGRLGNGLFQIASTIGIARKNGTDFTFPKWKHQEVFKKPLPNTELKTWEIVKEKNFHYDNYVLNPNYNYNLFGYWQSPKYWEHCKEEVLSYFQFTAELIRAQSLKLITIDTASIHVRRGDYLGLQGYHPVLPLEYYNKAIQQFPKEQKFIVFSDDIEWCKKHFLLDRFAFANGSEVEDLCLMSLCTGHIIANSSFSWWGAYLSGKGKVIAPINWFGSKANHNTKDLIPENWMRL